MARRHAAGAVGKGHQHAALDQAAAIVVLVLGDQRVFMCAVDDALPQRPDQLQEARGLDDAPALRSELRRLVDGVFHAATVFPEPVSSVAEAR